jgi:hypothetical protein
MAGSGEVAAIYTKIHLMQGRESEIAVDMVSDVAVEVLEERVGTAREVGSLAS